MKDSHSGASEVAVLLPKTKVVPKYDAPDPGHDDSSEEIIMSSGAPLKRAPPSNLFYFVTSWVLFVEGIGGISGLAVSYFYKNTLHASPALLSSVGSISSVPWALKPLFGFVSDSFPIFGYRRKPYIFIAGAMGGLSWIAMSWFVQGPWLGCIFLLIGSLGIGIANVISEALVVEKSRGESQEFASTLQSIIWGAQAVGAVLAAWLGGYLLTFMTDRTVFLIAAIFPLTFCFISFLTPDTKISEDSVEVNRNFREKFASLFEAVSRKEIAYPCAFIFLFNATPATGASWFFFYTNTLHFSSEFLGTINLIGSICTLAGVIFFQKYLKNVPFRPILVWSTLISTVLGLSQLILVFRLNKRIGIPDGAFCVGESAIISIVGWVNTMPILVLAARLCPKGMEGTMYAFITSVNNFGGIVGSQLGALITVMLGVTEKNLSNFWILVFICNASNLFPLLFISWIPKNDPQEKIEGTVIDDDGTVHYQDL